MKYNQGDEVVVQLQKYNFYNAQVISDNGKIVHVILKDKFSMDRDFMYDKELGITHNMIVEKTYDSLTDKCLVI
jgi:aspartate/methionine/tyrosine aminotransferase